MRDDQENPALAIKHNNDRINYSQMEAARTKMLQEQLKGELRRREAGRTMSLRRVCLRMVVDGNYKEAGDVIDIYLLQRKVYPALFERVEPHSVHAKELINAVRAKRNFPNLSSLSISKQQEILDNAVAHFDELKVTLKNIERMVKDEAVKDIRSSVYVVRTAVYMTTIVTATALVVEFTRGGLGLLMWTVFSQFADDTYIRLAKAIGLL